MTDLSPDLAAFSDDGMHTASDDMLLLGVRMRDEAAMTAIFDRYLGLVFTLALRMLQNRDLAEDVMEEVFVGFWHAPGSYDRSRGPLIGWLLAVTRQQASLLLHSEARKPRKRKTKSRPSDAIYVAEPMTPQREREEALRSTVMQAVSALSIPQREAIELAYFGSLTQSQIAEHLALPVDSVKARIRDGVRRLRRLLAPTIDGHDGGAVRAW